MSIYGGHGKRGIPGTEVRSHQDCASNATERIVNCVQERISFKLPYTTTLNGNIVFADTFFSQTCSMFKVIRDCQENIDCEGCESSLPQFIANSRALATKVCRNEKDLESILGCMNRQSFQQRMFQELTSENHQQQDLCRLIENTLGQLLETTESVCGQKDYRTLTRVMVDFDGDLSFVTGAFDDESAHCVISVNRVVPDAGVSVEVSQA